MKRTAINVTLAVLVVMGGYGALLAYGDAYERTGEEVVLSVMAAIDKEKRAHGSYPLRFEAKGKSVWGIFPGPEVIYRYDGTNCVIYYYQWPLGPHRLLNCRTREWHFEE